MSTIDQTPCLIREVAYLLPEASCDRCGCPAPRYSVVERVAVDLDLDRPILLAVVVSVHRCLPCHHYFRAQPPFLRTNATYSRRVVSKAVEAVHHDSMAVRRVPSRLARDFWVRPSEGMIRQWCTAYRAGFDFETDYQPWVFREFSGILCVDEVYQDDLALLLAVDPAGPGGDRLVGYQLVHGTVDADAVAVFLTHLKEAGIQPEEVITDGSSLYPAVLARIWPGAAHQLCLFHGRPFGRLINTLLNVIRHQGRVFSPWRPGAQAVPGRSASRGHERVVRGRPTPNRRTFRKDETG